MLVLFVIGVSLIGPVGDDVAAKHAEHLHLKDRVYMIFDVVVLHHIKVVGLSHPL